MVETIGQSYLLPWATLEFFIISFLILLNGTGNAVGGDFMMFCDKLLIGNWHLHENGFQALRYTPYFCGGTPVYNDPEDIFFSLLQLLSYVMDFWYAFNISTAFHLFVGYIGWHAVGTDVMGIGKRWSHLLALVVVSNGFYFAHIAAGHVTFQFFPLLGCLTWLLLDRRKDSGFSLPMRAACMALLAAWILYGGGYIVMLFWTILMCLAVPLEILANGLKDARSKTIYFRCLACGSLVLIACMSKLVAVASIMRHVPRTIDYWTLNPFGIQQIVDGLWKIPVASNGTFLSSYVMHERVFFTSPATLVGLLLALSTGLAMLIRNSEKTKRRITHPLALGVFLACYVAFLWSITSGRGVLFENLRDWLPFLQSLRVGARFLYIVGICASMGGIWGMDRFFRRHAPRAERFAAPILSLLTVLLFIVSVEPFVAGKYAATRDYTECKSVQRAFNGGKSLLPVAHAKSEWHDYARGATGTACPNALYLASNPHPNALDIGPIENVSGNTYNLLNPACDAYPKENSCDPGDKIDIWDKENFDRFRRGRTTTWELGWKQELADQLSILGITFSLCFIAAHRKDARQLFLARRTDASR